MHIPINAADDNDTLSVGQLLDFIDDLGVLTESEFLVEECASTDKTSDNGVPKVAHRLSQATPMSTTQVDGAPALLATELTDSMTSYPAPDMPLRLVQAQLTHLPLSDDDDGRFLHRVTDELEYIIGESTTPLHLQQTPLRLQSVASDGDSVKVSSSQTGVEDAAEQECSMPKKKTSSQRQRDEIANLRARVRELEGTLEMIKDGIAEAASNESVVAALPRGPVQVWAAAVRRQLERKNRAKDENALLRKKLAGEVRFAKSLDRILRKRKVRESRNRAMARRALLYRLTAFSLCLCLTYQLWDELHGNRKQPRFIELSIAKDSRIFEMLTRHVDKRVRTLGIVPDAQGFTDGIESFSSSPIVLTDDKEGIHIDLSTATTIPFDFQKIADIAWARLRPLVSRLTCTATTTHTIDQTKDCLASKQVRPLQLAGDTHRTTTHTVCKRVIQDNRVVMLWEMLVDAKRPGSLQSVQVRLKGFGEILRGEVTANESPSSRLRSTVSVVPHKMHDTTNSVSSKGAVPKIPKRKSEMVGLLSELVIASHQQHAQACHRFIENALFDDLIRCSNGSV
ncbi:hypothetical protein FI667_g11894, partial [Globisporangium splendens]